MRNVQDGHIIMRSASYLSKCISTYM